MKILILIGKISNFKLLSEINRKTTQKEQKTTTQWIVRDGSLL
jgi:hypothetical protein